MSPFHSFELALSRPFDFRATPFPTIVQAWSGTRIEARANGTHFGYVYVGLMELRCAAGDFRLRTGMYFSVSGPVEIAGGSGLMITREGYRGFFQVGGPIEETGRLRYIDGCTDSLLIAPVERGDPCLNLLHIPPGSRQTAHTHPSIRVGLIARGSGACITEDAIHPLRSGLGFIIPPGTLHSFRTESEELLVIAYHPDSDFGPTHECHPMINRTVIPREKSSP